MIGRFFRKQNEDSQAAKDSPLVAILDDEADLGQVLSIALSNRGYATAVAYDGESGLELIRQRHPLLVVLDIKMPRLNGYQVLALMQQDPQLAAIPVVVLTSVDDDQVCSAEEWARRLQVARFIAKPCEADKVAEIVAELAPIPS